METIQTLLLVSDGSEDSCELDLQPAKSQDHDESNLLSPDQLKIPNCFYWERCNNEICNHV